MIYAVFTWPLFKCLLNTLLNNLRISLFFQVSLCEPQVFTTNWSVEAPPSLFLSCPIYKASIKAPQLPGTFAKVNLVPLLLVSPAFLKTLFKQQNKKNCLAWNSNLPSSWLKYFDPARDSWQPLSGKFLNFCVTLKNLTCQGYLVHQNLSNLLACLTVSFAFTFNFR